MDPDPGPIGTQLLLLALLTMVNAFFACAEMAIVSVNKTKIGILADEGSKKAKTVQKLLQEPTRFLSTIQVAITLAGFFSSASAATGISEVLGAYLQRLGIPYGNQISFVGVTVILAFVTLVFGELVPKRIALQKAESISMFVVGPVGVVSIIAAPFVKLLSLSTNLVLRITGMHHEQLEEKVSEEEIRSMIESGKEHGVFNETEQDMIESIFEFDDKLASEVMTSRTDVYAVDINEPLESYLDEMLETRHSRVPVYDEDIDNIVGVLYIKDFLLEARKVGFEKVEVKKLLHRPYFVPETRNIDELFQDMQRAKQYIAVLIDEYGGFSGIVTMEDLAEEVMGPIEDQGDDDEPRIIKIDNSTYILEGLVTIDDLNDELGTEIESENHDTVSGLLMDEIGTIPEENDRRTVQLGNLTFSILEIRERRIEKLKLQVDWSVSPERENDEEDEEE